MNDDITPDVIDQVRRAIIDPMIGGWPLIHWEWVFALARQSRGIEIIGEWPESEHRRVTLRTPTANRDLTETIEGRT